MKLCAIVLDYRAAAVTETCLRSLVGQGLGVVLLVDNSADAFHSDELALMLSQLNKQVDYGLRLLRPACNLGFARGINLALRDEHALQCEAFLIINNDAVASRGMVARLASSIATAESPMAAPRIVDAAGRPLPMLWYQRFFGLLLERRLVGSFPYLSGCCILVRRDSLEEGRLFDEDFFMYGEDTLLGWRLACSGRTPLVVDDALVRHTSAGTERGGSVFYEYHMARAHLLLARKTLQYPLEFPLVLACKVFALIVRAVWRSLRYGSFVPLRAFWMSWWDKDIRVP